MLLRYLVLLFTFLVRVRNPKLAAFAGASWADLHGAEVMPVSATDLAAPSVWLPPRARLSAFSDFTAARAAQQPQAGRQAVEHQQRQKCIKKNGEKIVQVNLDHH